MKAALTIAGSDSSGGAGLQADLKVFSVLGVFGMCAVTALTVQNTTGVKNAVITDIPFIEQQIDTVASDIEIHATKTGMLANSQVIDCVADAIRRNHLEPYVCDPVMFARSGDELLKRDAVESIKKRLFPLATIITPNLRETAMLTGVQVEQISNIAAAQDLAKRLAQMGPRNVIIKAISVGDEKVDLLFDGRSFTEFAGKMQPANKTHGSGCAFSAAICAGLALRMPLVDAIDQAKQLVTMAIQYSEGQGRGTSPVNVLAFAPKVKK